MEESIRKAMKEPNLKDLSGVILHTHQGNSYRFHRYNQLSKELGIIPSISRKANCWDNAVIESFFQILKLSYLIIILLKRQRFLRKPFQSSLHTTKKYAAKNA